jgi:hypothetical protein
MPLMIRNEILVRAVKDPEFLTPGEVGALAEEVLRGRRFIKKLTEPEYLAAPPKDSKRSRAHRRFAARIVRETDCPNPGNSPW